ncbi:hypothetical protein NNG48_07240 [Enterococcus faecium]|nr:hypothetical protein [Enterococcus faecium]
MKLNPRNERNGKSHRDYIIQQAVVEKIDELVYVKKTHKGYTWRYVRKDGESSETEHQTPRKSI